VPAHVDDDANLEQGLPADAREYTVAGQILRDLGMPTVRLLTNNPAKVTGLEAGGATVVERVPLALPPDPRHLAYLRTKRDRMGHDLPHLEAPTDPTEGDTMDARLAAATLEATR
jgi:3,4-dihydroxy 2-butanone 4-phosphate synthase/GTP cyclohydrolase II